MSKIQKNPLMFILLVLMFIALVGGGVIQLGTISPGPEGIDSRVYAVQDTCQFASNTNLVLLSQTPAGTVFSTWTVTDPDYGWCDYALAKPDPYNTIVRKNYYWQEKTVPHNSLNYLTEIKRPQFWEVNVRGDPLGVREATEIVWQGWETQPTQEGNQIRWNKYGAYLVPVDYVVQLSCRAALDGSYGWTQDLHFWLVMDTVRWYNAFAVDGQLLPFETPEDAVLEQYKYRGAFPIFAWISEWDPYVVEDKGGNEYSAKEIPPEIYEYTQISPSLEGRQIPLYTSPDTQYQEILSSEVWNDPTLITGLENKPNVPDPRFAETVFTPITLSKFGALKQSGGWGPWYWEKFYYPTVFIRVRLLYLVWGQWNYLWTQQEADEQDYEWKERTSITVEHESQWDQFWGGVGGWFTSPWTFLWTFIVFGFLILGVLIVLAVFAPQFLNVVGGLAGRKKGSGRG